MIIIPSKNYVEYTESGRSLSKEFYCLSLKQKFDVIAQMELEELIPKDYKLLDKLIMAVLQHSPKSSIKEFPVNKERKIRPEAREADKYEASLEVLQGMPKSNRPLDDRGFISEDIDEINLEIQMTLDGLVLTIERAGSPLINPEDSLTKQIMQAAAVLARPAMYFGTKDSYEDEPDYIKAKEILN